MIFNFINIKKKIPTPWKKFYKDNELIKEIVNNKSEILCKI